MIDQVALFKYQQFVVTTLTCRLSDVIDFGGKVEGWEGLTVAQIHQLILQLNACNNVRQVIMSRTRFSAETFTAFIQALRTHSQLERFVLNGHYSMRILYVCR